MLADVLMVFYSPSLLSVYKSTSSTLCERPLWTTLCRLIRKSLKEVTVVVKLCTPIGICKELIA